MLPIEKLKHINQTKYEELKLKGFPADCLSNSNLDGIIISSLPKNFQISGTRFSECWIQNVDGQNLDLSGCILTDCIIRDIDFEEFSLDESAIYGTLFTGLHIGKLSLENATLRKTSLRDSVVDVLNLEGALLADTYFFRARPGMTRGKNLNLTLGGATEQEVNNYRSMIKRAVGLREQENREINKKYVK